MNQWGSLEPFHNTYDNLNDNDIPLAQDCFGDQYFYRNKKIIYLYAETGEIDTINKTLEKWYNDILNNPEEELNINLDSTLEAGKLFHAYPPFCFEGGDKAEIFIAPEEEVIEYNKKIYLKIKNMKDGNLLEFKVK